MTDGTAMAEKSGVRVRLARAAVDLDAAKLFAPPHDADAFATAQPIQRVWRDIHLAAMHIGAQPGIQLRAFRTDRAWPGARSEPTVFLTAAYGREVTGEDDGLVNEPNYLSLR